jgi:hypothetical protein
VTGLPSGSWAKGACSIALCTLSYPFSWLKSMT